MSLNVSDGTPNRRDAIDGGGVEGLEIAQSFQSCGTYGIFELVCIYTAIYWIHVQCFLVVHCIPEYVAEAETVQSDTATCK